jgi:trigger factor
MNITKENIDALNAVVKITLSPADYLEQVEKAIKDQSKKVRMPGFRPGMVPASHIKKLYGKSILVDEINRLLSDSLNKYITEQELNILGQPLPKVDESYQPKWDFNDEFEFSFEMGIAPEIKDSFSKKDKLVHYQVLVDDETLQSRLKNIRRSYGKMTNPEKVEKDDDVIYAELVQLSPDGSVFEGGISNTTSVRLDLVEDAKIKKSLMGLKKDDVIEIDLQKAYKKDAHRIAHLLNIEEDLAKDLVSNFRLTVKNVNRIEEADMNQEFFDKIYGEGSVNSEEAFIEKMKEELIQIMQDNADRKLQSDIYEYGVSKFSMNLPDEFLKRWLKATNEDKLSDEQIAEQYDEFAKNLRWSLIVNKIVKDNNIEIKPEEVVDLAKKRIDAQFRMYSPQPLTEDQLNQYAINFLQNREQANQLFEEVKTLKVFDVLKEVISLDKKEIEYSKFLELK